MSFETPFGFIGLLAIPLIILLYILKQKREKVTVPSLILWSRVLSDMQAKTPWQKLQKNLLLFLQIMAAILIVLALTGFSILHGQNAANSVIIVIDHSLSMASTDIEPTRLGAAKKDAAEYIDVLPNNCRVTVVSIGREADVLIYASTSKKDIKKSIESIQQSSGYADMVKAEELVLSLKREDPDAQIVLFSDTPLRFGNEQIQFSEYKKQTDNVAVTGFTHTKTGENITAVTTIRNQGSSEVEIIVSLYGDNEFLDSQWVTVPASETKTVWWDRIPGTVKTMRVSIETEDILPDDNNAYEVILSEETVKVLLVSGGNLFLEKVFSLIEGAELIRTSPEDEIYEGYDLYVFDGLVPSRLPEDGNILLFAPPPNNLFSVGKWMDTPEVGLSDHEIFKYLDKLTFSIGRTRIIEKPEWAEVIMEHNGNPIIMEGTVGNLRILIFGFDLLETDLPLRTEFPILISNIVNEYAPSRGTVIQRLFTGDAVQFRLNPDTLKAYVHLPDQKRLLIAPPIPAEPFLDTGEPGIYILEQIKDRGSVNTFFDVNILDEWLMEKDSYTGSTGAGTEYKMSVPLQKTSFKLTLPLLSMVIAILLFEWWYYANRNYI
ncbi:MAG: VWA domain-containing protein [Clostridiaceae bacterium]|nr:VWA domain-containing protein [Clostridiaceae bacterium]